jgi:hypothetical protein
MVIKERLIAGVRLLLSRLESGEISEDDAFLADRIFFAPGLFSFLSRDLRNIGAKVDEIRGQ